MGKFSRPWENSSDRGKTLVNIGSPSEHVKIFVPWENPCDHKKILVTVGINVSPPRIYICGVEKIVDARFCFGLP